MPGDPAQGRGSRVAANRLSLIPLDLEGRLIVMELLARVFSLLEALLECVNVCGELLYFLAGGCHLVGLGQDGGDCFVWNSVTFFVPTHL